MAGRSRNLHRHWPIGLALFAVTATRAKDSLLRVTHSSSNTKVQFICCRRSVEQPKPGAITPVQVAEQPPISEPGRALPPRPERSDLQRTVLRMRKLCVFGVTCAAAAGIAMAGSGIAAADTGIAAAGTGSSSGSVDSGSAGNVLEILKILKLLATGSGA
ncbi:hypothetical protein [Nocardia altamirensis]|uniref:hypothetical protein n=1 Tax=Nocardia altamirensis TaxID=472158 RepID=UPI00114C905B|nr:hypothetical protein [Nocardia altamirensis]